MLLSLLYSLACEQPDAPPVQDTEPVLERSTCVAEISPLFESVEDEDGVPVADLGTLVSGYPTEFKFPFSYAGDCTKPRFRAVAWSGVFVPDFDIEHVPLRGEFVIPVSFSPNEPGELDAGVDLMFEAIEDWPEVSGPTAFRIRAMLVGGTLEADVEEVKAETPVGCSETLGFEVRIVGAGPVRLNGIDFAAEASPEWSIKPVEGPILVEAGTVIPVTVAYAPDGPGSHQAVVRVRSPHTDNLQIALVGTGFYPNQHADQFVSDGVEVGFPLSEPVGVVVSTLEIRVGGVLVSSGWSFSEATGSILFESGNLPDAGVSIDVAYATEHDC